MYPNPLFWETAEGGGWLWPHPVDATAQFDAGAGKMAAELAEEHSTSPPTIMALRKIRLHDLDNSNSEFLLFIQVLALYLQSVVTLMKKQRRVLSVARACLCTAVMS